MRRAIALARRNGVEEQVGGPFGCVVVRDGEILAEGVNEVVTRHDPTCHAEVMAIRAACEHLGTHVLEGCVLFSSCEPCPMCYAAAWWARVEEIYYGATIEDALRYGDFDDRPIYQALDLPGPQRRVPAQELLREEMVEVWRAFRAIPDRIHY